MAFSNSPLSQETVDISSQQYISGLTMSLKDPKLFESAELQQTDPSKHYIIKHDNKIGAGAFGKVFKVKRKAD